MSFLRVCVANCVNGIILQKIDHTKNTFTLTEDRATQECDPSAGRGLAERRFSKMDVAVFIAAPENKSDKLTFGRSRLTKLAETAACLQKR
jgi:hypothetical protein